MENVTHEVLSVRDLVELAHRNYLLIDKNYSCKMWGKERQLEFVQNLIDCQNVGVFHIRSLKNAAFGKMQLVDGVQRVTAILNVLCGKGFFFDLEKNKFTLEEKYVHGKVIERLDAIICSDYKKAGASISEIIAIQDAINSALSKRIFVCSYDSYTSLNEIHTALNNGNVSQNGKMRIVYEDSLFLDTMKVPFFEKK